MILMDSLPQKSPLSCEKNFFLLLSFRLRFCRIPQKEAGPMMLFLVDLLILLRQQSLNFYLATSTLSISSNLNQQLFDFGGETFSIFIFDVTSQTGRFDGRQRKVSDMKRDSSIWLFLFFRNFYLRKRELRWCPVLFQLFSPTYTYKWYSPKQLAFQGYLSRRSQLSDPSFFSRLELRRFDGGSLFSFGCWVRTAVRQICVRLNSNEFLTSFLDVELNLMLLAPSFLLLSACMVKGLFISSNSDKNLSSSQRFSRLAKVSLLFFPRSVFGSWIYLILSTFFSLLFVYILVFCATSASKLLNSFIFDVSNSSFSSWASDSQSSSISLIYVLVFFMVLSSSITSPKRDLSLQTIFKGYILLKKDISSSSSAFPSVIEYLEPVGGRFFCLEARLSFSSSSYSSYPTTNLLKPSAIETPIFLHSSQLNCLVF